MMPTRNLREQIVTSKAGDGSFQLLSTVVYTSDCVLRGNIRAEASRSLVDVLNDRSGTPCPESTDVFLPLFGVEGLSAGGSWEQMQPTYVSKDNILFAAQSKVEPVRRGKRGKLRSKDGDDCVMVVIYVPSHILVGRLPGDSWHTLAHSLSCQQTFLSLSEVMVSSLLTEGESRYALVAINSGRVLHMTQLSKQSERTSHPQTVDGILAELLGLKCDRDGVNRPVTK